MTWQGPLPEKYAHQIKLRELCFALGNRTTRFTRFVRDDMKEQALRELEEVRTILNQIEEMI